MGKRSQVTDPVCQVMTRDVDGVATFVVYGPNRDLMWLFVHTVTPTIVRLWPLVVRFLRDILDALTDPSNPTLLWRLPSATAHPEYVAIKVPGGDPWLYIFAVSPNAIRPTTPDNIPPTHTGRTTHNGHRTHRPPPNNTSPRPNDIPMTRQKASSVARNGHVAISTT
jgi:hypothetical protein